MAEHGQGSQPNFDIDVGFPCVDAELFEETGDQEGQEQPAHEVPASPPITACTQSPPPSQILMPIPPKSRMISVKAVPSKRLIQTDEEFNDRRPQNSTPRLKKSATQANTHKAESGSSKKAKNAERKRQDLQEKIQDLQEKIQDLLEENQKLKNGLHQISELLEQFS